MFPDELTDQALRQKMGARINRQEILDAMRQGHAESPAGESAQILVPNVETLSEREARALASEIFRVVEELKGEYPEFQGRTFHMSYFPWDETEAEDSE